MALSDLTKKEAIEILNECKPTYKRIRSIPAYVLTEADVTCLRHLKRVYESEFFDNQEVLEAAGLNFETIAVLTGKMTLEGLL